MTIEQKFLQTKTANSKKWIKRIPRRARAHTILAMIAFAMFFERAARAH